GAQGQDGPGGGAGLKRHGSPHVLSGDRMLTLVVVAPRASGPPHLCPRLCRGAAARPRGTLEGRVSEERANPGSAMRKLGTAWVTTAFSATALLFSAFCLWESRLKRSDLRVFVPPVIQYSAPQQNTNFEVVAIPVTIA